MEAVSAEVQEMADAAQRFAQDFASNVKGYRLLYISGVSGAGKTHCAEALFKWASRIAIDLMMRQKLDKVPRIELFEWAEIVNVDAEQFLRWIDDRRETQLLFLEDVGAEVDRFKTGEPTERFREVLNAFKHKSMVLTSNIHPDNWKSRWDTRIADRLLRNSTLVTLRQTKSYAMRKVLK